MNLNQIKYQLISFFENHGQINETHYEDDFDFNAERNLTYPVSNIEYLESNISGKTINHSYKIVLGDLLDQNIKGHEDEIYSDSLLIAEDFFAWIQNQEGVSFNKSSSIQKFIDDTHDRTAGIVFKITLATIRSQNDCQTPLKN